MNRIWSLTRSTVVPADAEAVWQFVVTPAGINHEMKPWLTMSVPRGAEEATIDSVQLGAPIGKAWLRLFGVLPFDYDNLSIADLEPGEYFREKSTMLAVRRWEHQRRLTAEGCGTRVQDTITFEPRLPLPGLGGLVCRGLRVFFGHRHRRLVAHFSDNGAGGG